MEREIVSWQRENVIWLIYENERHSLPLPLRSTLSLSLFHLNYIHHRLILYKLKHMHPIIGLARAHT